MSFTLWSSWSEYGRLMAASMMKIPIDGVVPTTNHLESFNGLLKRKHLARWLHSGHRLRFDTLIYLLTTRILPDLYSQRRAQQAYSQWLTERFGQFTGGIALKEVHKLVCTERLARLAKSRSVLAWWVPDANKDDQAKEIVRLGRITQPLKSNNLDGYVATCASTSANLGDPYHTRYEVMLERQGVLSSCTCQDFMKNGGACKHLRSLRIIVDAWIMQQHESPFFYPSSRHLAQGAHDRLANSCRQVPMPPEPLPPIADWSLLQQAANDSVGLDVGEHDEPIIECGDTEGSSSSDEDITDFVSVLRPGMHQLPIYPDSAGWPWCRCHSSSSSTAGGAFHWKVVAFTPWSQCTPRRGSGRAHCPSSRICHSHR